MKRRRKRLMVIIPVAAVCVAGAGTVDSVSGKECMVTLTDNGTTYGDSVTVTDSSGKELGSGELVIHEPLEITGTFGTVSAVNVSENASVSEETALLTLEGSANETQYQELLAKREARTATLKKLIQLKADPEIKAEISGTVQSVNVSAGSSTSTDSSGSSSNSSSSGSSGSGKTVSQMTYKDSGSETTEKGAVQLITLSSTATAGKLEGYIPFSTMTRLADNVLDVTMFYASGADEDSLEPAENALTELLMEHFGQDEDAFSIVDQSEIMEAMSGVTNTMSLMIGGIAAISLLVGGIGIMNIMLVSVTERTREIGIRKAIGAGRGTIMLQFLIEALLISLMGCLAGIGLSWLILKAAAVLMDDSMSFTMDMKVVWLSVAFSVLIGVLFGLYPANKAASRKPIDALRYSG